MHPPVAKDRKKKIETLRAMVKSGRYVIQPERIAAAMLARLALRR
ncbi:MAG: flagellar biosynthesis anti-sigma factor FlgM [Deltaproteobacteria bacterium]|nr:flagellar biosynthesis anti-sigma factor FlgM [Deltaproteobacteria bacterium]